MINRNRTPSEYIGYGLYLYFSGLSLRRASERLSCFIKRNPVSIRNWIQKHKPKRITSRRKNVFGFVVDETLIKVGSGYVWLWVAIEPIGRRIPALSISKERNMSVAERFIAGLVGAHGKHPVSTDGGTWHPQACKLLKLKHHIHSPLEKGLIERAMQYIKGRTECFGDYFPWRLKSCKMEHVMDWLRFFADYHNSELVASK